MENTSIFQTVTKLEGRFLGIARTALELWRHTAFSSARTRRNIYGATNSHLARAIRIAKSWCYGQPQAICEVILRRRKEKNVSETAMVRGEILGIMLAKSIAVSPHDPWNPNGSAALRVITLN